MCRAARERGLPGGHRDPPPQHMLSAQGRKGSSWDPSGVSSPHTPHVSLPSLSPVCSETLRRAAPTPVHADGDTERSSLAERTCPSAVWPCWGSSPHGCDSDLHAPGLSGTRLRARAPAIGVVGPPGDHSEDPVGEDGSSPCRTADADCHPGPMRARRRPSCCVPCPGACTRAERDPAQMSPIGLVCNTTDTGRENLPRSEESKRPSRRGQVRPTHPESWFRWSPR